MSMASKQEPKKRLQAPATTPEGRTNQLIALATDLAAKQLAEGTASSQVITHYLKEGSQKTQLENDKLKTENDLLKAKIDALKSAKNVEELYAQALKAMREYSGLEVGDHDTDSE